MAQILNNTYEITDFIGKGDSSLIFKARHIRLNEDLIVKAFAKDNIVEIPAHFGIQPDDLQSSVVRILDIFEDEKLIYIVTDYVDGEDLQTLRERVRTVPEGMVVTWFRELAEILRSLHAQEPPIIYRKMKPSKVMVQKNGKLKVLESGIVMEHENEFAAPEQFMFGQCDERSDIYSLGLTMYYLATGKGPLTPPFGYLPARQVNPAVSQELEDILDRCVKYDPEERYQSAEELLQDLYQ
ncbi:MAG: serine/threonine protein kinase [Solobacterium sp.]|nr:serine/threonine protein kinase [Solobacterium sp.]